MELTEQEIMNAFGLEAQASDTGRPEGAGEGGTGRPGVTAQEPAEPAQAQTPPGGQAPARAVPGDEPPAQGETAPEPAAPAEHRGEAQGETGPDSAPGERERPPQSPEENRRFAAARRKAEQEAALEAARQEAREAARQAAAEEVNGFLRASGLRNPYSNTPITTMEEFRQYQEQHRMAQLRKELSEGRLTPEGLNAAIDNAWSRREQQARTAEGAEPPKEAAGPGAPSQQPEGQKPAGESGGRGQSGQAMAAQARIDAEVAEIGRLDPAIQTVSDLLTQPWSKEFYQYVQEGYSFLGAYHKAVSGALEQQAAAAAKQQAINQVRSKDHLKSGAPQGGGMEAVPAAELRYFRTFLPDASDSEIQKYYNSYKHQNQ